MNFVLPCLEIIVAVIKRSIVFVFFFSIFLSGLNK